MLSLPYLSLKKAYEKSPYVFEIKEIKSGLYQAKNIIFPALLISARPRVKEGEFRPLNKNLIVCLAKDLDIDYGESTPKIKLDKIKKMVYLTVSYISTKR